MRVYTHAELAQEVEDQRNTAMVLSALSGVAGAVSASQAGHTYSTGSVMTTSPYGTTHGVYSGSTYNPGLAQAAVAANTDRTINNMAAIEGQAQGILSQLQTTIIKDYTLMPGEWHGGVIVLDAPDRGNAGDADYTIMLAFDGEEHEFSVSQQRGEGVSQ